MEIQHSTTDGCQVVTLTGSIDLLSAPQIQRALLKDLSEEPFAVICDLAGVDTLDPVCATVFATVANHPSSRWPATSFLLCGAQPPVAEILGLLTVPHFLELYASLQEAVDAAVARPPFLRDELVLAPIPTAAAVARAFVREVCRYWQLALADSNADGPGRTVGQRAGHQCRTPRPHRTAAAGGAARRAAAPRGA